MNRRKMIFGFLALLAFGVAAYAMGVMPWSQIPFDLDAAGKLATTAIAVFALVISWMSVRETRRAWVQNRIPQIVVTIESTRVSINHMDLVIENVGGGPAFEIEVKFDPDLEISSESSGRPPRKISSLPVLRSPILKPHQRIPTFLTSWRNINPKRTTVTSNYKDVAGSSHISTNIVDLSCFEGLAALGTDPLHQVARESEQIRRAIENLASGFSRLHVDVHTAKDRAREEAEREAWMKEAMSGGEQPSANKADGSVTT